VEGCRSGIKDLAESGKRDGCFYKAKISASKKSEKTLTAFLI